MSTCAVCENFQPKAGQVCDPCRGHLAAHLSELPDLIAEATQLTLLAPPSTWEWRYVGAELGCANRVKVWVHAVISGPTGSPGRVRVTGTRTAPLPVSVELLNIVGPGSPSVSDPHGDQIGELPTHVWLREVASDWADQLGYTLRYRSTPALLRWIDNHLDWACNEHPGVGEFADELRRQRGILRGLAGRVPPRPEPCDGVACPRCDLRALYRQPGSAFIHCGTCPNLLTREEYDEAVKAQAKVSKRPLAVSS